MINYVTDEIEQKRFIIIGAGGIGSHMGLLLARMGAIDVTIYDNDKLEFHNLSRTPYPALSVDENKAAALVSLMHEHTMGSMVTEVHRSIVRQHNQGLSDIASERTHYLRNRIEQFTRHSVSNFVGLTRNINTSDFSEIPEDAIVIETIDKYFGPDEMLFKERVDWKLNYDNTWMTVTSNPYDLKDDGTPKMNLEELSQGQGYTITPSFYLTPEILTHMLLYRIAKEGWRVEGTRQYFSELTRLTNGVMQEVSQ